MSVNRYEALFEEMQAKKKRRTDAKVQQAVSVATTQQQVAASLLESHPKKKSIAGSLKEALGAQVVPREHKRVIPSQMSIDAALSKPVAHADLRAANNARLTTAIADMFHAENLQDRLIGTHRFREVIEAAKMVGPDYKLPNRNDIGGFLLKQNSAGYKQQNYDDVTKDGPKFGYAGQGDGATVIKRPFFCGYVMNGNCYPIVACIRDCTKHLAAGGTKDCVYIADLFTELVDHYDPKGTDWDIFYFDGAGNVQKAGRVLETRFPRTTCLYGGEHALALWFAKVAKIPVIRVRYMLLFFCLFRGTNY